MGPWQVTDDRALVVTGSDQGGLTKTGALWENYTLTFEAKIVNRCLGVIVRAQDLDNYYMLQINKSRIRPHRRVAVPAVQAPAHAGAEDEARPITYTVGWQLFEDLCVDLSNELDQWFTVRISVRGEALEMHVNDNLSWQHGSFLKIATGKIGFRSAGAERALVRKVRVKLDP